MSWRNCCPDGLEGRANHRSAPQEENGDDNAQENGNLPNQGGRHRIRRGLVSSHAALSYQGESNVSMASAASIGAAAIVGDDELMVPLFSGEVIRGGMLAATATAELAVPAGVGASGGVAPCQGEDSNGQADMNRSRTPIRSGSRSLGGSSTSNEGSGSDGRRHVMAIPEARRELIYRLLSSERCDCGEVNCPH